METSAKYKWQVRLAALLLFVVGVLAGILATNLYRERHRSTLSPGSRDRFEHVLESLDLTPDQRAQVQTIFDDTRAQLSELRRQSAPKFREVREQTDERLRKVLTPEQWQQFQQLMSGFRERRSRGREKRSQQP
jgi:Spy/CpxP family protein refolding chaperone